MTHDTDYCKIPCRCVRDDEDRTPHTCDLTSAEIKDLRRWKMLTATKPVEMLSGLTVFID